VLHYPIAASLARDYLAIMASSVSSERAFSSAGLTISKRRNQLQGDIVEALQCLKCMYHNDLIFREVVVATEEEVDLEEMDLELAADASVVEKGLLGISCLPMTMICNTGSEQSVKFFNFYTVTSRKAAAWA
jgi:hypothetical protein